MTHPQLIGLRYAKAAYVRGAGLTPEGEQVYPEPAPAVVEEPEVFVLSVEPTLDADAGTVELKITDPAGAAVQVAVLDLAEAIEALQEAQDALDEASNADDAPEPVVAPETAPEGPVPTEPEQHEMILPHVIEMTHEAIARIRHIEPEQHEAILVIPVPSETIADVKRVEGPKPMAVKAVVPPRPATTKADKPKP